MARTYTSDSHAIKVSLGDSYMKSIHYCNIGMAKSGTTALFAHLQSHPQVDYRGHKENYNFSHYDWSLDQYQQHYQSYNTSLNFCPAQWCMDSDQIQEISQVITHASICLRNPWSVVSSLYTFTGSYQHQNSEEFVDMMLETNQVDYAKIIDHWTKSCNKPFLILYYDDLDKEPKQVYHQITAFLGLNPIDIDGRRRVNVTAQHKLPVSYRADQKVKINSLIQSASDYLAVNLDHWKQ